jgi:predicted NAD-dependent protein-ADP-ribosyltransferase YbiA (DUF1768 family)
MMSKLNPGTEKKRVQREAETEVTEIAKPWMAVLGTHMKTILQPLHIILIPESEEEQAALAAWRAAHTDFVFATVKNSGIGATLKGLGPRDEACREPINVTSTSPHPIYWISNFAPSPFELDGFSYSSVESFWQSLRFPSEERSLIASLDAALAKREGAKQPYADCIIYNGASITTGTFEHWQLMRRACKAKFEQNAEALAALLATGERPLVHIVRRDSRTIPGVIMADIWMRLRQGFRRQERPA